MSLWSSLGLPTLRGASIRSQGRAARVAPPPPPSDLCMVIHVHYPDWMTDAEERHAYQRDVKRWAKEFQKWCEDEAHSRSVDMDDLPPFPD